MLTLAGSPALRRQMGLAGRRRTESVYDIRVMARKYLDSVLSLMAAGNAPESLERKRFLEALIGAEPVYLADGETGFSREQAAEAHAHPETTGHDDGGRLQRDVGAALGSRAIGPRTRQSSASCTRR